MYSIRPARPPASLNVELGRNRGNRFYSLRESGLPAKERRQLAPALSLSAKHSNRPAVKWSHTPGALVIPYPVLDCGDR